MPRSSSSFSPIASKVAFTSTSFDTVNSTSSPSSHSVLSPLSFAALPLRPDMLARRWEDEPGEQEKQDKES
jgi:hypothetical protein